MKPLSLSLSLLAAALVPLLLSSCADYYGYGSGYGYGGDGYYDASPYYGGGYYGGGYHTSSLYLGSSYYRHKHYRCSKCGYNPCRCKHHSTKYKRCSKCGHHPCRCSHHRGSHNVAKYPGGHSYHGSKYKPGDHRDHADRHDDHSRSHPRSTAVTSTRGRPVSRGDQQKMKPTKSSRPPAPRTSSPPASRSKTSQPSSRSVRNVPVTTTRSAPRSSGAHRPKAQVTNPNPRGKRKK